MKHLLRVISSLLLSATFSVCGLAQAPSVIISFDNPVPGPPADCDIVFTEEGVPMQFLSSAGCSFFYDPGSGVIGMAPSLLSIDVSGLGDISKVEVDILDYCTPGCSTAELLNIGFPVASESNTVVGMLETVVLDNAVLLPVDEITLTSFEGEFHEVRIYEVSGCAEPSGLMATPVVTAASISWSAVATATEYVLQYRATGAPSWISVSTSGTSMTLTGLLPSTAYEYRVQAICDGDMSPYSAIATFTTTNNGGCVDSDGDGICDIADLCPGFDDNVDRDGNSVPDYCDDCDFIRVMMEPHLSGDIITYPTILSVTSDHAINSGADIVFMAGDFVSLEPGFNVILGAEFEVIMQGCSPPTR